MKKLFPLCLLLLTLALFAVSASALTAENPEDFQYSVHNEDTETCVWITGLADDYADADTVIIPDTIEGYPVTEIGQMAFYGCTSLTDITIPNSVTAIGTLAFFLTAPV